MGKTLTKIISFQVHNNALYVLDAEGTLWVNLNPENSKGWKVVALPTIKQHDIEDAAAVDRYNLNQVEKLNLKLNPRPKTNNTPNDIGLAQLK